MFLDLLISNLHKSIYRFPEVSEYLRSRFVTDDEIRKYEIGYNKFVHIPEDPGEERERMRAECYRGRLLENKVIFPLKNGMNKTVGILGRAIKTKEFKKFVLEETKLSGFFFGLSQALPHIYKENKVFVVEGPIDLFALIKVFPNTVATLISGLSETQYDFLKMYCDTIVAVFDSDAAGRRGRDSALVHKGVVLMDLKSHNDPAKCLETLKLPAFKKFILQRSPLF